MYYALRIICYSHKFLVTSSRKLFLGTMVTPRRGDDFLHDTSTREIINEIHPKYYSDLSHCYSNIF